jgi:hypothetical protein
MVFQCGHDDFTLINIPAALARSRFAHWRILTTRLSPYLFLTIVNAPLCGYTEIEKVNK